MWEKETHKGSARGRLQTLGAYTSLMHVQHQESYFISLGPYFLICTMGIIKPVFKLDQMIWYK